MLGADDEVRIERPGRARRRAGSPVSWYRKPATRSSDGSGSIGSWPARSRANAASADGEKAVSARACSTVGGHGRSCVAPQAETAVRSASIGLVVGGQRPQRRSSPAAGTGAVGEAVARIPLAGPQQVRDRRVGAVLDEVADPVAAIQQPAALAVDVGEAGLAGDDALEARRVRSSGLGRVAVGASAGGESVMRRW